MESQIMEEATRLFADRGFAGTSLQDIADATGLTRPALYHYFGSKEDLLSRLVSEFTGGPADELGEIQPRRVPAGRPEDRGPGRHRLVQLGRLVAPRLGARVDRRTRHDDPEDPAYYVVMHDPEGNEFCVS